MNSKTSFSQLITSFLTVHLARERNVSKNTIASYSDCLTLLITYVCERFKIETEAINIEMLQKELILDFLDYLEKERNNSPSTRNQRLAIIKSLFHYLSKQVPELMLQNERIQDIKSKSTDHCPPPSLTILEITAIIDAVDTGTLLGLRDKAIIQLMYRTGARVQEVADLQIIDLHLDAPFSVELRGKGNKKRVIPLDSETVEILLDYINVRTEKGIESGHLFLNNREKPITRFGIGGLLSKHAKTAAKQCTSLCGRKITPHVLRHTCALHLIEAGVDLFNVKDWLGHADIKTTSQYVEVSMERKRKALEQLPHLAGKQHSEKPKWKKPDIMTLLAECSGKRYVG